MTARGRTQSHTRNSYGSSDTENRRNYIKASLTLKQEKSKSKESQDKSEEKDQDNEEQLDSN